MSKPGHPLPLVAVMVGATSGLAGVVSGSWRICLIVALAGVLIVTAGALVRIDQPVLVLRADVRAWAKRRRHSRWGGGSLRVAHRDDPRYREMTTVELWQPGGPVLRRGTRPLPRAPITCRVRNRAGVFTANRLTRRPNESLVAVLPDDFVSDDEQPCPAKGRHRVVWSCPVFGKVRYVVRLDEWGLPVPPRRRRLAAWIRRGIRHLWPSEDET